METTGSNLIFRSLEHQVNTRAVLIMRSVRAKGLRLLTNHYFKVRFWINIIIRVPGY